MLSHATENRRIFLMCFPGDSESVLSQSLCPGGPDWHDLTEPRSASLPCPRLGRRYLKRLGRNPRVVPAYSASVVSISETVSYYFSRFHQAGFFPTALSNLSFLGQYLVLQPLIPSPRSRTAKVSEAFMGYRFENLMEMLQPYTYWESLPFLPLVSRLPDPTPTTALGDGLT